jgi:hypothetical protein
MILVDPISAREVATRELDDSNDSLSNSELNDTIKEDSSELLYPHSKLKRRRKTSLTHLVSIITSTKPFQFHQKHSEKAISHPVHKLLTSLITSMVSKKSKQWKNIRTCPVRTVLKFITEVKEKVNVIREEGKEINPEEVLYDTFFNKYGISKLTEKKFKEVLLTIDKNKIKVPEIGEFAAQIKI